MADRDAILAGVFGFDGDAGNVEKIWRTHAVAAAEAEQALLNRPLLVSPDRAHSAMEARFFALGEARAGRRLAVVFTIRGDRIRVISARPMSRKERIVYAEAKAQAEADTGI